MGIGVHLRRKIGVHLSERKVYSSVQEVWNIFYGLTNGVMFCILKGR